MTSGSHLALPCDRFRSILHTSHMILFSNYTYDANFAAFQLWINSKKPYWLLPYYAWVDLIA